MCMRWYIRACEGGCEKEIPNTICDENREKIKLRRKENRLQELNLGKTECELRD